MDKAHCTSVNLSLGEVGDSHTGIRHQLKLTTAHTAGRVGELVRSVIRVSGIDIAAGEHHTVTFAEDKGIGAKRRRIVHSRDRDGCGIGLATERRGAAIGAGIVTITIRATGLVPSAEGEGSADGAVVASSGLEVQTRVGSSEQTGTSVGNGTQSSPSRAVIDAIKPSAIGSVGSSNGNTCHSACIEVTDVIESFGRGIKSHELRDERANGSTGCTSIL